MQNHNKIYICKCRVKSKHVDQYRITFKQPEKGAVIQVIQINMWLYYAASKGRLTYNWSEKYKNDIR